MQNLKKNSRSQSRVRYCQQIIFVTLNGFKKKGAPPCSEQTISKWIECQSKSHEKYIPFLHTSYKNCKIQQPDLLFLFVLLAFTSAGIIFYKYLELHLKIPEKKAGSYHSCLSTFQKSKSDINLSMKY